MPSNQTQNNFPQDKSHLDQPILNKVRKDAVTLRRDLSVEQALCEIRRHGPGEAGIFYFYVVDDDDRLVGVIPARRLLTAQLDQNLLDIMVRGAVVIPHTATVLETCEYFVMHKYLAFPVVDENKRVLGVVDVNLFTEEAFDIAERERIDAVFETIGLKISELKGASAWRAFCFRFPWLLPTIFSGTICAILVRMYEATLAKTLALAFFMVLVLGLAESVSIQSMTVAIQSLRSIKPTLRWYFGALGREISTALLLGGGSGFVVGSIVWLWRGAAFEAAVVALSILLSHTAACLFGLSVPTFLHASKLDMKIAAGPITLALTDVSTLLIYFTAAVILL